MIIKLTCIECGADLRVCAESERLADGTIITTGTKLREALTCLCEWCLVSRDEEARAEDQEFFENETGPCYDSRQIYQMVVRELY